MSTETIHALLTERAASAPHKQAIIDDREPLNYSELSQRSMARAAWLVANGVNKGHRVGLQMPNGIDWAINAYALMRIGAVLVPFSTLLRPAELYAQLALAGVRHLIMTPEFRARNYRDEFLEIDTGTLPSLRNIWWQGELGDAADGRDTAIAEALANLLRPADDMVIIFTSGSSGAPKGVIHTHGGAIRANAAGLAARCIHEDTRLYLPMPFFWVGGFAGGLLSALNAGATLLTESIPESGQTLEFLAQHRVTLFRGWPDQAAQLAAHPRFGSVDLSALVPGSLEALLPRELHSQPGSRANLFGMTETFGPYCGYPLDAGLPEGKWGSCGLPFPGMDIRIVNPDSGALLLPEQIGSIQVGGRNILRGICGREREAVFTSDGWYDTGDRGRLDEDGFLYFTGRCDDMIKVRGATVYPSEVVSVLESIAGVARACAVEIAIGGQTAIGAAVVCRSPGALSGHEVAEQARTLLSAHKLPTRWVILDSAAQLPRTATGKIDRAALQALILSG